MMHGHMAELNSYQLVKKGCARVSYVSNKNGYFDCHTTSLMIIKCTVAKIRVTRREYFIIIAQQSRCDSSISGLK
jgi:hypothetical protein